MFKYVIVLLVLISSPAYSATGIQKGIVEHIRVHDTTAHSSIWAPPVFWFTLEGVTSAGSCAAWRGNVLFAMDTKQAYSMVLAAFMAGKEVAIRFDDTILISTASYCKATHVTLGKGR